MTTNKLLTIVSLMLGAMCGSACNAPDQQPPDPATCDTGCDDGNPCTHDVCSAGQCVHEGVTPGDACLDAEGFCDSDAVCRTECPKEPCQDAHLEMGTGCMYDPRPNGWTCNAADYSGTCSDGQCVPPMACNSDADCNGTDVAACASVACVLGACTAHYVPFGRQCQGATDPTQICDGLGSCGQFMPYGSDHCYTPQPLPWSECPTCDDADPTTADSCETIGGLEQCVHAPLPEGHMCGPWYTIQGGQCCPHPDTLP